MRIHNTHAHLRLPDRLAPAKCALMRCEVDDHATNGHINNSSKNKNFTLLVRCRPNRLVLFKFLSGAGVVREWIRKSTRLSIIVRRSSIVLAATYIWLVWLSYTGGLYDREPWGGGSGWQRCNTRCTRVVLRSKLVSSQVVAHIVRRCLRSTHSVLLVLTFYVIKMKNVCECVCVCMAYV